MSNFYGKPTTSELRPTNSVTLDLNGEGLDFIGEHSAHLAWTEPSERIVISGSSDVTLLSGIRGALLSLKNDVFNGQSNIVISSGGAEFFDRRLLLLEHEIDGLLRRKINYTLQGEGGRVLDYTGILNEKETQIVELEKKIQNLEERLRRSAKRESELEDEIVRLKGVIKATNNPNISKGDLDRLLIGAVEFQALNDKFAKLKAQFSSVGGLLKTQFASLRSSGARVDLEANINQLLSAEGLEIVPLNGIATITQYNDRVVEVPVQDARTKHLVHLLAVQLKRFVDKYPKLRGEADSRLTEFFQQEIIDLLEADDFERLVSIVKYVPEYHRVENVYAYSSEKSRKVEFHLRVLIKALLEELEKLKLKYGAVLDIDEGVIGMINQEILGVVSVDDILKVFRVVPKIVEVEKVVEKIVERVVEVPQVIAI